MKIFFYLTVLISLNTFGQNSLYEIEYVCTRTLNFKVQSNDVLYVDVKKNISYYKEGEFVTVEAPDFSSLPSNAILIKEKDDGNKSYVYTNFNENKIIENIKLYKAFYLTEESIPKLEWVITNEIKNTNDVILTKATTNFRGRNYEVWFSYEYPISIGPWKFHGLPGLIFEVVDLTEPFNYHWSLKKISNTKRTIPFSEKNIRNVITSRELLQNFKDQHMNETDIIMSRSGVEFEPTSLEEKEKSFNNYRQLKREIKYEWEN